MDHELLSAAHHEAGHAVIAHLMRVRVNGVSVRRNIHEGRWDGDTAIQYPSAGRVSRTQRFFPPTPKGRAAAERWSQQSAEDEARYEAHVAVAVAGLLSQAQFETTLANAGARLLPGQDFRPLVDWLTSDIERPDCSLVFFDGERELHVTLQPTWYSGRDRGEVLKIITPFDRDLLIKVLGRLIEILNRQPVLLSIAAIARELADLGQCGEGRLSADRLTKLLPQPE